jgi:hypothetical protein
MSYLQFSASLVRSLAWPVAGVIIVVIFKDQLRHILSQVRKFGAAGVNFEISDQVYAYETTLKGLNKSTKTSHVLGHKYYGRLYEKKIEFYRSGLGIASISDVLKKRKKENDDTAKLLGDFGEGHDFDIDEVDEDDYFDDNDDNY